MANKYTRQKVDLLEAVKLYESGMTQTEVAKELGTTQRVIWHRFKEANYKSRIAIKRNQFGKNNDSWKGDNAKYDAHHVRVRVSRGQPKKCEVCGTNDKAKNYHWASLTGKYEDPPDYKRMCHSCHSKYDNIIKNITKGVAG